MKVALCLSGFAGGNSKKVFGGQMWNGKTGLVYPVPDFKLGYKHYKKHIFDNNDVDVFMHSWSTDLESPLCDTYHPKMAAFEKDRLFHPAKKGQISAPGFPDGIASKKQITLSRWYSLQKSVQLKKQWEEAQGFTYDCVMVGRFDVAWLTDVHFNKFDMNFFYASNWCVMKVKGAKKNLRHEDYYYQGWDKKEQQLQHIHTGYPHTPHYPALADYWFFANSKNMDKFSDLYLKANKYIAGDQASNHKMAFKHLCQLGLKDKLRFAFHIHNDCHLVRHIYCGWRDKK
jgi:hypothetical protein